MKLILSILTGMFFVVGCGSKGNFSQVPDVINKKLSVLYPKKLEKFQWTREKNNYRVSFRANKVKHSVLFDPKGKVLESRIELIISTLHDVDKTGKGKKDNVEMNMKMGASWQSKFNVKTMELFSEGINPFFLLQPGYQLKLKGTENGESIHLIITVLNKKKTISNVKTRIVEEREYQNCILMKVVRKYYAIDPNNKNIFCFGESMDIYNNRKIVSHRGSWQSGRDNSHFGLTMPGRMQNGRKYLRQIVSATVMYYAEIISTDFTLLTPAGTFEHCLKIKKKVPYNRAGKNLKFTPQVSGSFNVGS